MSDTKAPDYKSVFGQLEKMLDEYLGKKAPAMPENVKETLAAFGPYLSIISIALTIPAITAIFGLGSILTSITPYAAGLYYMNYLGVIGIIVSAVFNGLAIPGLFKRSIGAWRLMYYAALANFVGSVIQGNITSALLGALIGMYILFQVKSKYK